MKWYRINALLHNYYYFSINSIDRMFDIFFWPILDLFIWGFVTTFIQGITEFNVINTILGGIVLWVFIWRSSTDFVVYLLESYWSRSVYHLFASPIKNSELMSSLAIVGVIRSLLAFIVLSVLSFLIYSFNFFSFNLLHLALLISILLLFSWGLGLYISSFVFRYGTRLQVLGWSVIWMIQPFSCVFYPLSALPTWAAAITKFNPLTHIFEQLRATIAGEAINYATLGYAALASVALFFFGAWMVNLSIAKAKKVGTFAKPE